MRQEESPGQQRKLGSDTRNVSQDRLIEPSGERRNKRTSQDHKKRVSMWAEQSARETRTCAEVQEGYYEDKLYLVMRSRQKKGSAHRSSIAYSIV